MNNNTNTQTIAVVTDNDTMPTFGNRQKQQPTTGDPRERLSIRRELIRQPEWTKNEKTVAIKANGKKYRYFLVTKENNGKAVSRDPNKERMAIPRSKIFPTKMENVV